MKEPTHVDTKKLWPATVGAFLINFGAVEMTLLRWIEALSKDEILRDVAIDLPLNKRLSLVCDLIKRSNLPVERKNRALGLWGEVAKISETRNIIAHSPFVTHDGQNGFLNVKKLKGMRQGQPVSVAPLTLVDIARDGSRLSVILEDIVKIS